MVLLVQSTGDRLICHVRRSLSPCASRRRRRYSSSVNRPPLSVFIVVAAAVTFACRFSVCPASDFVCACPLSPNPPGPIGRPAYHSWPLSLLKRAPATPGPAAPRAGSSCGYTRRPSPPLFSSGPGVRRRRTRRPARRGPCHRQSSPRPVFPTWRQPVVALRHLTPTARRRLTRPVPIHRVRLAAGSRDAAVDLRRRGRLACGWSPSFASRGRRVILPSVISASTPPLEGSSTPLAPSVPPSGQSPPVASSAEVSGVSILAGASVLPTSGPGRRSQVI